MKALETVHTTGILQGGAWRFLRSALAPARSNSLEAHADGIALWALRNITLEVGSCTGSATALYTRRSMYQLRTNTDFCLLLCCVVVAATGVGAGQGGLQVEGACQLPTANHRVPHQRGR